MSMAAATHDHLHDVQTAARECVHEAIHEVRTEASDVAYYKAHESALEQALTDAVNDAMDAAAPDPLSHIGGRLLCASGDGPARLRELSSLLHREVKDGLLADPSFSRASDLATLRGFLVSAQAAVSAAESAAVALQEEASAALSSRAGYLEPLIERLGPAPANRRWQDEFVSARAETNRHRWAVADGKDPQGFTEAEIAKSEAKTSRTQDVRNFQEKYDEAIDNLVARGWPREQAECANIIPRCCDTAIGRALRDRDPCYSALTYACTDALIAQARRQQQARCMATGAGGGGSEDDEDDEDDDEAGVPHSASPPPDFYKNLHGMLGLSEHCDPAWASIEEPDRNGFCGLTCSNFVFAQRDEECFQTDGYAVTMRLKTVHTKSDVVRFQSSPPDEHGWHEAVHISTKTAIFPPNTLFRLVGVEHGFTWPNGTRCEKRLLTVRPTYLPATGMVDDEAGGQPGSKLCGSVVTLSYASREAYVRGLDVELDTCATLSMALEFDREYEWHDWKGRRYTLREEYGYCSGVATTREDCTPGTRDANNPGRSLEDFVSLANAHIASRRQQGHGTSLPEQFASLTREEVLAVRLYSGPAFQVINAFLRQVGCVSGGHRTALVRHAGITFAATTGHLCRAIRKLAAVATPAEATRPLWRGVRGELPRGFFMPDAKGFVCAVEYGFMSTSRRRQTPIDYLSGHSNVLWEMQPLEQSDAAYHHGADISMLSQFGAEEEVLYPPGTMLVVQTRGADDDDDDDDLDEALAVNHDDDEAEAAAVPASRAVRQASIASAILPPFMPPMPPSRAVSIASAILPPMPLLPRRSTAFRAQLDVTVGVEEEVDSADHGEKRSITYTSVRVLPCFV